MKINRVLIKFTLLFLGICGTQSSTLFPNNENNLILRGCTTFLSISAFQLQSTYAFPFDFIFKRFRSEEPSSTTTFRPPTVRTSRYYELAQKFMDWALQNLDDESDEDDKTIPYSRIDVDQMATSEEESDEIPSLNTLQEKVEFLRKGRLGIVSAKTNNGPKLPIVMKEKKQKHKESEEFEQAIESASLSELKYVLDKMKKDEEGIFSSKLISNPITNTIFSFGRSIFNKVYCGWSPQSNYCTLDEKFSAYD